MYANNRYNIHCYHLIACPEFCELDGCITDDDGNQAICSECVDTMYWHSEVGRCLSK